MDLRINRHFITSKGRLSAFLAFINIYNRENIRNINYSFRWEPRLNRLFKFEEEEYWFKLLPSIGVTWSWGDKN